MTYDLVIKNGLVVDGSGSVPFPGDLGVVGDTIVAVGKVDGKGEQEIDAQGHAVTPGFIDLHTHLDAQVGWDPLLTPISYHGVTTALMGNCGVTFAPCKPADHELLAGMMESVEDIPKAAILGGLPWDWESYGEYLDSVARLRPAINLAGLVGHSAVRFYVMGERAIDHQPHTDEIEQIAAVVGRSIRDGAFGCSINRLHGHAMPDGRDIPGTDANEAELIAIASAIQAHGGLLQTIPNYAGNLKREMQLLHTMGRSCRRILWSSPIAASPQATKFFGAFVDNMRADGIDVTGLSSPRSGGFISGISAEVFISLTPLGESWKELKAMKFPARLAAIQDAAFRARLIADAQAQPDYEQRAKVTFPLGDGIEPNWMPPRSESLYARSRESGQSPVVLWLDAMVASEGKALFLIRTHNQDFDALRDVMKWDWVLPGLGDAGAHVSISMDSAFSTLMLSHWVRREGLFSLEAAVHRLTGMQARTLGLRDRGVLAVGKRADINVIDMNCIAERQPKMLYDFPGGAPRLTQRAVGYRATVCNGQVILRDDEHTGARPGRVLRSSAG